MTVTHTGSTKKYSAGWENIFSGKKLPKPAAGKASPKKKAATVKKTKRS